MRARSERFEPVSMTGTRLSAYATILADVFGPAAKFESAAIAWRYRENPVGEAVGMDAWDGDTLAAHYVTCPLEARIDGKVSRGLLSLNTATDPRYQGRGLFTALANETYARGAAAGYDFVIGVANANSTPGFTRKLGFQLVGPLEAGLMIGGPRRIPNATVQYEAHWSEAAWTWRLANPAARYSVAASRGLTVVRADTGTPLLRCVAFLPEARPSTARKLPGLQLFMGLNPGFDLSIPHFVPIPNRLRPSPLNLIWRSLSDEAPTTLDRGRVTLNFLDFDPY